MAYYRRPVYRDNSLTARLFRGAVFSVWKPKTSYRTAVGSYNYRKTRKAIQSGSFRGYSFRNGRNAPPL